MSATLELRHCLRTPAEGPGECDIVLTCSKFLTTSDYAPRLRACLEVEQQLIDDATGRGWQREIERHEQPDDAWSNSSTTWPDACYLCRYACLGQRQLLCTDIPV